MEWLRALQTGGNLVGCGGGGFEDKPMGLHSSCRIGRAGKRALDR